MVSSGDSQHLSDVAEVPGLRKTCPRQRLYEERMMWGPSESWSVEKTVYTFAELNNYITGAWN